jgi:ferredoxin
MTASSPAHPSTTPSASLTGTALTSDTATSDTARAQSVSIRFLPQDLQAVGWVGEPLLDAALRAGISIPTGCMQGSCHACEVELDGQPVCSCITAVPPSEGELTVDLYSDPTW